MAKYPVTNQKTKESHQIEKHSRKETENIYSTDITYAGITYTGNEDICCLFFLWFYDLSKILIIPNIKKEAGLP